MIWLKWGKILISIITSMNNNNLPWIREHKGASLREQNREYLRGYLEQQQDTGAQHSTVPDADAVAMETNDQRWPDAARHARGSVWRFVHRKLLHVWFTQQQQLLWLTQFDLLKIYRGEIWPHLSSFLTMQQQKLCVVKAQTKSLLWCARMWRGKVP